MAYSNANTALLWRKGLERLQQRVHSRLQPGTGSRGAQEAPQTPAAAEPTSSGARLQHPVRGGGSACVAGQLWQERATGRCRRGCSDRRQCPLNVLAPTKSRDFGFAGER